MSTLVEDANRRVNEAADSLATAVGRRDGNLPLPEGITLTYDQLQAEVTACRGVLERAQLNYDNALAANRGKMFV